MALETLNDLFANARTTLKDIEDAGWTAYSSSSGRWWWEKREGKLTQQFLPRWVEELIDKYYKLGVDHTQMKLKHAIGIKDKDGE